jgi:hypothetical protein
LKTDLETLCISLKANLKKNRSFIIPVISKDEIFLGSLRLIDKFQVNRKCLIKKMTIWRNASMGSFLTQFNATEHRTKEWLDNVILPASDRLLFELLDDQNNSIGHAGVINFNIKSAELDNFIRGEKGGDPLLFYYAELAIIKWLFNQISVSEVLLHVFSNNWIPINNHLELGFSIVRKHKLSKLVKKTETTYLIDSDLGDPVKFNYLRMCLSKVTFFSMEKSLIK